MKNLPFLLLLTFWSPDSASAQVLGGALFAESGFSVGPQGFARIRGLRAEVGLQGSVRGAARWSRRAVALGVDDGPNPTPAGFLEFGVVFRLGGAYRVVPFADVMVGASREKKPYRDTRTTYTSASASLGMDFRVIKSVFIRLGFRRQEVFGTNRSDGRRGDSNGVFAAVGLNSW